jgi:hypothetical protein
VLRNGEKRSVLRRGFKMSIMKWLASLTGVILAIAFVNVAPVAGGSGPRLNDNEADAAIVDLQVRVGEVEVDVEDIQDAVFQTSPSIIYGSVSTPGVWNNDACPICSPACGGPGGEPLLALDRVLPLLEEIYDKLPVDDKTIWLDPTLYPISTLETIITIEGPVKVLAYPTVNCRGWKYGTEEDRGVSGLIYLVYSDDGKVVDVGVRTGVQACGSFINAYSNVVCAGGAGTP